MDPPPPPPESMNQERCWQCEDSHITVVQLVTWGQELDHKSEARGGVWEQGQDKTLTPSPWTTPENHFESRKTAV